MLLISWRTTSSSWDQLCDGSGMCSTSGRDVDTIRPRLRPRRLAKRAQTPFVQSSLRRGGQWCTSRAGARRATSTCPPRVHHVSLHSRLRLNVQRRFKQRVWTMTEASVNDRRLRLVFLDNTVDRTAGSVATFPLPLEFRET